LLLAFWFTTLVFAERHFGTRILRLAESLTLAWVIIKLSSRLVRSDQLARALAVLAFMIAALNIAGLLGTVTGLLDSMAVYVGSLRVILEGLELGDFKFSQLVKGSPARR